ncbi:hypothetical protein Golob_006260 [Gossypium lobatum]|uniref:Uncharacterized protein n=1 Tax=Gossypium lobatum TaxID=34289 RepID=A0A7J8MW22_9ROSI|nr:hypothetical protein [Gossypium lobatum]
MVHRKGKPSVALINLEALNMPILGVVMKETRVESYDGVRADVMKEILRKEARVKGKRIGGLIGLKTNEGVLNPNIGGVGSIFEKNPSGSGKDDMLGCIVVEDQSNVDIIIRRKLPDDNMGDVEQPILELSSAMEGIVRNLHRDREWYNVESSSLKEGKSLEVGFNRSVGISGSRANEVRSELGYPNSCQIEANGFSGGI